MAHHDDDPHHHDDSDRDAPRLSAKILTVSDGVHHGTRDDASGVALAERLDESGWIVTERAVCEDGEEAVSVALARLVAGFHGLVVTTGGTGFGPRDLTPEGTRLVLDRDAPGLAEAMRLVSPFGRLSRAIAGTADAALIINTPGSARGCIETLDAVLDVLPHAVRLMIDNLDPHPTTEP